MADSLIPEHLGPRIGQGRKRKVYEHPARPDLVVKVTKNSNGLANRREHAIWEALRNREEGSWLAEVYEVSDDYRMLVQERLTPVAEPPPEIPEWMSEAGVRHWGRDRNGSLKHCDFESKETRRKLKKHFGITIK